MNFNLQADKTSKYYTPMYPFATGVVQEDQNGNYNFESSDVLEYTVDGSPTDTANGPAPITISAFQSFTQSNPQLKGYRFEAPSVNGEQGGYWLLIVQRDSPYAPIKSPNPCTVGAIGSDGMEPITNCGAVYPTGDLNDTSGNTRHNAIVNLTAALNAIGPYDLAFLTSWGMPACCQDQAHTVGNGQRAASNGFLESEDALQTLGASGRAVSFGNNFSVQGFAFVTSSNTGDPLVGNGVLSSTAYSASGQAGYVHGTLARNLNGLFQNYQSSQQLNAPDDQAAGPDYTLTRMATLQPVAWPELSAKPISGADTSDGQEAAYSYISYTLITQHYIKSATGPYLDDIHYFFTGSNSNYINYHYFDPSSLPWPGRDSTSYTWLDPVTQQSVTFTEKDFQAVTAQVSTEVAYVTNVVNFMLTGPVNMKDMISSGSSNAGLALTAAAANVLSSSLSVSRTTPIKVNTSNVLTLISGVASIASAIAGVPELEGGAKVVVKGIAATTGILGGALGGGGDNRR